MSDPMQMTLREAAAAVRARKISPLELAQASLSRIRETEPKLNAYVRLTEERAMAAARQAEREIAAGINRGELHGVPVAVKDLYDMAGLPTTCSSKVRQDHIAPADAACVVRLEQAGAVIVGKTHTHEFAYGAATPTTGNPWNTDHIPGGSSGGSGATVAARGCFMAMGTDTGGSIRIPAAVCGTVGIKPTYGRVSRFGVASLSWSLDHTGPLTRTVGDAAVCMGALAGYDPRDPGSANQPVADYLAELELGVKGLRIGVPSNYYFERLDPDVERNARDAIARLKAEGAELVDVALPLTDRIMPVEFGLLLPEASAYHHEMLRTRRDLYEPDVLALLEAGELMPATDYIAAQRVRGLIQAAWRAVWDEHRLDAIVAPAVPIPATRRGETIVRWPDGHEEEVIAAFVRLSAPANVTGLPSVAVPSGFSAAGLPTSIQVIGRPFHEARILRVARAYERVVDWASGAPAV
jgi:aspartyl-tRNA(Asn)/glutamyl-tRNA(Gln) amidotransferase subunit A